MIGSLLFTTDDLTVTELNVLHEARLLSRDIVDIQKTVEGIKLLTFRNGEKYKLGNTTDMIDFYKRSLEQVQNDEPERLNIFLYRGLPVNHCTEIILSEIVDEMFNNAVEHVHDYNSDMYEGGLEQSVAMLYPSYENYLRSNVRIRKLWKGFKPSTIAPYVFEDIYENNDSFYIYDKYGPGSFMEKCSSKYNGIDFDYILKLAFTSPYKILQEAFLMEVIVDNGKSMLLKEL